MELGSFTLQTIMRTWFESVAGGDDWCRGRTRLLQSLEVVVVHEEALRGFHRQVVRIDRVQRRHHREERHGARPVNNANRMARAADLGMRVRRCASQPYVRTDPPKSSRWIPVSITVTV